VIFAKCVYLFNVFSNLWIGDRNTEEVIWSVRFIVTARFFTVAGFVA